MIQVYLFWEKVRRRGSQNCRGALQNYMFNKLIGHHLKNAVTHKPKSYLIAHRLPSINFFRFSAGGAMTPHYSTRQLSTTNVAMR